MGRLLAALLVGCMSCYNPSPPAGSPCPSGMCPTGQVCSPLTLRCETIATDIDAASGRADLTVGKAGSGSGTVTSTPSGIDCGSTCTASYDSGLIVSLVAVADTDSTFTGWSGGGCSGTDTCFVSAAGATTVTAEFSLTQYTLSVSKAGNGAGTVTSDPSGIDCGTDCALVLESGQSVTLTASPSTGSTFSGWSGGCAGTGTCMVTIGAAASVTATFTLTQHALSVTKNGTGNGLVTSNVAGINCGADCSQTYNYGTNVVLSASPDAANTFKGWSGSSCSGTGTCTVSMTAARTVNATFDRSSLSCTTSFNVGACFNGAIPEINLGALSSQACHDQCQIQMATAGMTSGCWIRQGFNNTCYCRSGQLANFGNYSGGSCN